MAKVASVSFWFRRLCVLKEIVTHQFSRLKAACIKFHVSKQVVYWTRKGVFPVEIRSQHGMGAKLTWSLAVLCYCQEKNLIPQFRFSTREAKRGEDFFGSYFITTPSSLNSKSRFIRIQDLSQLGFSKDYHKNLDIETASRLVGKHFVPQPELWEEVNQFVQSHFDLGGMLGVHYRGTDKSTEAPFVGYENVLRNIDYALHKYASLKKVFITTDDHHFIEFMKSSPLAERICLREDSFRSSDGVAIHGRSDVDPYGTNRDAVVNMLILTRCAFLIKTASFLSSLSILYNPAIPYMMLNQPFGDKLWFPERELIKNASLVPVK